MTYQERLAERKRIFQRVFPTLSENGNGDSTTIPMPMSWDYVRGYWPRISGSVDNNLLPCEKKLNPSMLRPFVY